jgi:hypothetical protein
MKIILCLIDKGNNYHLYRSFYNVIKNVKIDGYFIITENDLDNTIFESMAEVSGNICKNTSIRPTNDILNDMLNNILNEIKEQLEENDYMLILNSYHILKSNIHIDGSADTYLLKYNLSKDIYNICECIYRVYKKDDNYTKITKRLDAEIDVIIDNSIININKEKDYYEIGNYLFAQNNKDKAFIYYNKLETNNDVDKQYVDKQYVVDYNKWQILNSPSTGLDELHVKYGDRLEISYKLAERYRHVNDFDKCYIYATKAYNLMRHMDKNKEYYMIDARLKNKILDELSISSYYIGKYSESLCYYNELLLGIGDEDGEYKNRIKNNLKFSLDKLDVNRGCILICINNDSPIPGIIMDYINLLKLVHIVYIFTTTKIANDGYINISMSDLKETYKYLKYAKIDVIAVISVDMTSLLLKKYLNGVHKCLIHTTEYITYELLNYNGLILNNQTDIDKLKIDSILFMGMDIADRFKKNYEIEGYGILGYDSHNNIKFANRTKVKSSNNMNKLMRMGEDSYDMTTQHLLIGSELYRIKNKYNFADMDFIISYHRIYTANKYKGTGLLSENINVIKEDIYNEHFIELIDNGILYDEDNWDTIIKIIQNKRTYSKDELMTEIISKIKGYYAIDVLVYGEKDNDNDNNNDNDNGKGQIDYKLKYHKYSNKIELTDQTKHLFWGNDYLYREDIMDFNLKQMNIWNNPNIDQKYNIVIKGKPHNNFSENIRHIINNIDLQKPIIIQLSNNGENGLELTDNLEEGVENGYIITNSACKILMIDAFSNGIKTKLHNFMNRNKDKITYYRTSHSFILSDPTTASIYNPNGIKEYDDYEFYSGLDYYGSDIKHIGNKTVDELKKICDDDANAVGFNTLGWVKYHINVNTVSQLYGYNKISDGLYVKKIDDIIKKKIMTIMMNKESSKESSKDSITFTITTCKRYTKFKQTMDNLLLKCMDIDLIQRWICIDDNSSSEDRINMQREYPFFEYILKAEHEKGHARSMNILWNRIQTDYVMHFEDDWMCYEAFRIKPLLELMTKTDQILLRKNCWADHIGLEQINGKMVYNQIYNHDHTSKPIINKKYDIERHSNITTNYGHTDKYWWWPGFTLNPSIFNFKKIKETVGYFNEHILQELFEYDYALRGYEKNIKTSYIDYNITHIGDVSSYSLNNMKRYYDK